MYSFSINLLEVYNGLVEDLESVFSNVCGVGRDVVKSCVDLGCLDVKFKIFNRFLRLLKLCGFDDVFLDFEKGVLHVSTRVEGDFIGSVMERVLYMFASLVRLEFYKSIIMCQNLVHCFEKIFKIIDGEFAISKLYSDVIDKLTRYVPEKDIVKAIILFEFIIEFEEIIAELKGLNTGIEEIKECTRLGYVKNVDKYLEKIEPILEDTILEVFKTLEDDVKTIEKPLKLLLQHIKNSK